MIETVKVKGEEKFNLTCDKCGTIGGQYEEFIGAVRAKKTLAWICRKQGGLWMDYCKDCKGSI